MKSLEFITNQMVQDYSLMGQVVYPDNSDPFVWDYTPSVNTPEKVLIYFNEFSKQSWGLVDDPNMDIDYSYWFYDKTVDRIRLSEYNCGSKVRCIHDNEENKQYPALLKAYF